MYRWKSLDPHEDVPSLIAMSSHCIRSVNSSGSPRRRSTGSKTETNPGLLSTIASSNSVLCNQYHNQKKLEPLPNVEIP